MKHWIVVGGLLLAVGGCAFFQRHVENVKTGLRTPQTAEERTAGTPTVWAQGRAAVEPLAGIPYVQWLVTPLGLLAALWFADKRGAKLRAGAVVVTDPHPGLLSNVVQTVANISKGIFEVGADGSPAKRTWKTVAAGVVAGLLTQLPALHAWALGNPTKFGAVLVTLTGLIMGLEKMLSAVQPVVAPTP